MANIAALIPSLIGLAGQTAGAIPGLRKSKRTSEGSTASAEAATRMANAAVGGAQAGQGASRGLALREGLRAAGQVAGKASRETAMAAQRDEIINQQRLDERNARIADFASGAAGGLSQMGQAFIKPEDASAEQAQAALQAQPEMGENVTGLQAPNAGMAMQQQDGLQELPVEPEGPTLDSMGAQEQADADAAAGPVAKFQTRKALDEALMTAPMTAAPEIEVELEQRLQMKNLMLQEAERLGINLSEVAAGINRKLSLNPGQSGANPMGLGLDYTGEE